MVISFPNFQPLLPGALIVLAALIALAGFVAVRYRSRLITGFASRWITWRHTTGLPKERVLIVGGGQTGHFAAWILGEGYYADSFKVLGFTDDDLYKQDTRIRGLEVLGSSADIPRLVTDHDVGILLFAIHNISAEDRRNLFETCSGTPARLVVFPDIPAALNGIADRNHSTSVTLPAESNGSELPCHLCLVRDSPVRFDLWLAQLSEIAAAGDITKLQAQIRDMRTELRAGTAVESIEDPE